MDLSLRKVGGTCSVIQGILFIVSFVIYSQIPQDQIGQGFAKFAISYNAQPIPSMVMCISFALLGILGMVEAPAIAEFLGDNKKGLVLWGRNLAYLGLATMTIYYVWFLQTTPGRVATYLGGSPEIKAALEVNDPQVTLNTVVVLSFGLLGIWVWIITYVVFTEKAMPSLFGWLSVIKAIGFWTIVVGMVTSNDTVTIIGAVIGGLLAGSTWHVWIGVKMSTMRPYESEI